MKKFEATLAIIGIGYVGLPLAIEFSKKRMVVGFDISRARIQQLKNRLDVTREISCEDLIGARRLIFTSEIQDIKSCGTYIITVPTPVDSVNRPDMSNLVAACEIVGSVISQGSIVIFESTVYPGATEEVCVPVLEQFSGMVFNKDFFCGYSPERINPGDKVNTITKIKKITSGSNAETAVFVDNLYREIIDAGTYKASSIKVAEAAKVIENCQRDLNIAFVNELSIIFNRMGLDTLEILEAAGSKWNFLHFRPGMVGGHCIGVDPYYLTYKAEQLGYQPQIILSGRRLNDDMARYAAKNVIKKMVQANLNLSNSVVGVFGFTFKENCPDIRNSKVYDLICELKDWGLKVVVSDPWASPDEVKDTYGLDLKKPREGLYDSIIVSVGHNEYRKLTPEELRKFCKPDITPIIGDIKSLYSINDLTNVGFIVFRL
jgi:UDP-N-acetyl-D-galactosamine dehydrogenase